MKTESQLQDSMNKILQDIGIKVTCCKVVIRHHLAYFDLKWSPSIPISALERSLREIALGIQSKTVPIIKVITELGIVRLQVAMRKADTFSFNDIYSLSEIPNDMLFPICLGVDENGEKLWMDMSRNPHLLIAGGTGSGKSTILHTIISNALQLNACFLRRIEIDLVDPKRIEFCSYEDIELKNVKVYYTYEQAINLLEDTLREMENRYSFMVSKKIKKSYPAFSIKLLIIDEIADLILQDKNGKLERLIILLAQKGRSAGIHIILSTQRPSVDVLTGVIKANFPGRIACKTASKMDSKVILDEFGAEHLLGRGDAIIRNIDFDRVRFQVAYVTDSEAILSYQLTKKAALQVRGVL
jgi:S-DNA-T family DNA segregation ATPase FtsK/SpoIIIE